MDFKRINNDVNGNPRYVTHFFNLLKESERTISNYGLALRRAKTLGGKKYRGSDFGGGIVFQSYNIAKTERIINELVKRV